MSEVRSWLEAIGLAQYSDAFEANDIDIDLLGQVDDQILKDIGVSSAGHRLRIRNAIAKLGPEATTARRAQQLARQSPTSRSASPRSARPQVRRRSQPQPKWQGNAAI